MGYFVLTNVNEGYSIQAIVAGSYSVEACVCKAVYFYRLLQIEFFSKD